VTQERDVHARDDDDARERERATRANERASERTNERRASERESDDRARVDAPNARANAVRGKWSESGDGRDMDRAADGTNADASASASAGDFRARYDAIRDDACRVTSIEIRGLARTRRELVERELERAREARTLDGIKDALFAADAALREYGIFKEVAMVIDADNASATSRRTGEDETPGAKVVVSVEERDLLQLRAGTFMSKRGEGELEAAAGLRNALGRGDKFQLEFTRGASSSSTYSASYEQPRLFGSDVNVEARLFQSLDSFKKLSSFDVTSRGLTVGLTGDGPGTVDYTLEWRDVRDPMATKLAPVASRAVRKQLGETLKSAVTHTYVIDRLDRRVRPTSGYLWKVRSELAGIGLFSNSMATKFAKSEVTAHAVETLNAKQGITASLTGRFGVLLPLGKTGEDGENETCIADRFFLGGVGCLRQFETNGAGPSDERRAVKEGSPQVATAGDGEPSIKRDALGGDFVWSATAAVQMDVPGEKFEAMREAGIHFHAFASAGTLLPITSLVGGRRDAMKTIRDATRASVGIGMVWPLPIGQIEINYGRVIRAGAHDRAKNGFQVGLAAHVSM